MQVRRRVQAADVKALTQIVEQGRASADAIYAARDFCARARETAAEGADPIRCSNPDCQAEEAGAPFQKCSACKVTTYCGPDCQRSHWKAHKPSCKAAQVATSSARTAVSTTAQHATAVLNRLLALWLPRLRYNLLDSFPRGLDKQQPHVVWVDTCRYPSFVDFVPVATVLERMDSIIAELALQESLEATRHLQAARSHALAFQAAMLHESWPQRTPALVCSSLRLTWTADALPLVAMVKEVAHVSTMAPAERAAYMDRLRAHVRTLDGVEPIAASQPTQH